MTLFLDADDIPPEIMKYFEPLPSVRSSVFAINARPYLGAHFATWPPELVEPMILSGSSPQACEKCGAPWERELLALDFEETSAAIGGCPDRHDGGHRMRDTITAGGNRLAVTRVGGDVFKPTCKCKGTLGTARCTVLDPFSGSGTTGMVALQHGRNYIGLDMQADYLEMAKARIQEMPAPTKKEKADAEESVLDLLTE